MPVHEIEYPRAVESPPQQPDPIPQPPPQHPQPQTPNRAQMMLVVARILGFRFQLLLAFGGAVSLSAVAVARADWMSLVAATVFDVLVFLPVLWSAHSRG